LICPIVIFLGAFAADTPEGVGEATMLISLAVYYPLITILSIVMSERKKSYLWAFAPLIFVIVYPILSAFNTGFFAYPVNLIAELFFGSKLY
jgi:hypothetical protein